MEVHLRDLFARFEDQFGSGPGLGPSSGTSLLLLDSLPAPFIKHLFRASAALFRTDPWKRLRPSHLLGLRVGKDSDWSSNKQPFPCAQFIGADGGDLALHLFKSDSDALKMTGLRETIRAPNIELFRVVFVSEPLLSSAGKRMVRSLSLEPSGPDRFPVFDVARCTSSGSLRFRNPTLEELRYVYAFMKAIALLHPLLQPAKDAVPKRGRVIRFEPFIETVDVQWPQEVSRGWDLVAVTVSHPPGQAYEEKKLSSSSPKFIAEPPMDDSTKKAIVAKNWNIMRQCMMCEKDVPGEQCLCCGRCRAAVYCGPVCQKQHWKDEHKSICGVFKAMMEREEELALKVFTFPCFVEHPCKWLDLMGIHQKGMWRRRCDCYAHCPFGLLPLELGGVSSSWGGLSDGECPQDTPFVNYMDGVSNLILLSCWSEYYNLRSLPMSSPVSAILSHSLTVYHILTSLSISSKNRLIKGKEVVVHYLGPEAELDWMPAFGEIGHLLNGVGNVQIVMIGPEVPGNLSGSISGISGRVRVSLVRGIYQEQASYLSSAHVVIALNCKLESFGSWGGALELIKSTNVPAFFTDKSEILCANAKQVLRGAGLHISHPVTPNPFRSPLREQAASSNLPSFSNGFVFGVNT